AEAWLYRVGDARKAAAAAQKVIDAGGEPEIALDARHLVHLAWAAAGEWAPLAKLAAEAAAPAGANPEDAADAAALALDRTGDAAAALEIAATAVARGDRAIERARGTPPAVHWLRVIDVAIDAAF